LGDLRERAEARADQGADCRAREKGDERDDGDRDESPEPGGRRDRSVLREHRRDFRGRRAAARRRAVYPRRHGCRQQGRGRGKAGGGVSVAVRELTVRGGVVLARSTGPAIAPPTRVTAESQDVSPSQVPVRMPYDLRSSKKKGG